MPLHQFLKLFLNHHHELFNILFTLKVFLFVVLGWLVGFGLGEGRGQGGVMWGGEGGTEGEASVLHILLLKFYLFFLLLEWLLFLNVINH